MKKRKIILALRNEDYFLSLGDDDRAHMPENPAGVIDMRDEDLLDANGAGLSEHCTSTCCCTCTSTCSPTACTGYSAGGFCCC